MEPLSIIPGYQPIPLPAPVWLLKPIILIGFYMHAIPMNVALVGGLVAGLFLLLGKNSSYATRLGNTLAISLPFFTSTAITFGIVPLLFLQLIYGPFFYTSSILMAVPWFLIIIALLIGYYGFYIYTYQRRVLGAAAPWVLLGASVFFMAIAFTFVNNMTLMLRPEFWVQMYQNSPYGLNLNLVDPQVLPRYLHFITASFAVTGVTIGCFGLYWSGREADYGTWLLKTGAAIFLLATLLQILFGVWFLLSLPHPVMMNYMGQDAVATGVFVTSLILILVALVSMFIASQKGQPRHFIIGAAAMFAIIGLMIFMRHLLREYLTRPYFQPETAPVNTQWLLIGLFLVGAAALIAYLTWLLGVAWQAFHPPGTSDHFTQEAKE